MIIFIPNRLGRRLADATAVRWAAPFCIPVDPGIGGLQCVVAAGGRNAKDVDSTELEPGVCRKSRHC